MAEHATLYREFLPTLSAYGEMAKRALELQIKICEERFKEAYPEAVFATAPLIAQFSARETPAKLGTVLAALEEKQIEVARVSYDPQSFTYSLYGAAE